MAHVAQWKKDYVDNLLKNISGKKVIGLVKINNIPATQLNQMRRKLDESNIFFKVSKKTILKIVLDNLKSDYPELDALKDHIDGQVAVVAGDINPFKMYMELTSTMMPMAAKGGEIAPDDIWVRKGETPFKPGPIISELASAGIPAAIDKGKVVIKTDKLLVKKGEVIPKSTAFGLTKLEIYPLEVGLSTLAMYEDGIVFTPDDLDIDMDEFINSIIVSHQQAMNLALHAGYASPATIEPLITKAHRDAKALALEAGILTPETVGDIIAKAHAEMMALTAVLDQDALDDELKGISSQAQATATPVEEVKDDSKNDENKDDEEEAAAGLGALFG